MIRLVTSSSVAGKVVVCYDDVRGPVSMHVDVGEASSSIAGSVHKMECDTDTNDSFAVMFGESGVRDLRVASTMGYTLGMDISTERSARLPSGSFCTPLMTWNVSSTRTPAPAREVG